MSGIVLMYHRIAPHNDNAYGLVVRPDNFAAHLEHLRRLNCVVPLAEIKAAGIAPRIAMTFDDGYVDNATTAAPMLVDAGLPATFFITTGRLNGRSFWWDRLAECFNRQLPDHPDGVDVVVAGRKLWLDVSDERARALSLRFIHRRLRPLPPDELEQTVTALVHQLDAPEPHPDTCGMSEQQLRDMAMLPNIDIGAHTRTHPQLAGHIRALQEDEVIGTIDDLAEIMGSTVSTFAYPFGTRRAVGDLAPELVREAGCTLACTTETGPVVSHSDPYRLPRYDVADLSGTEFAAMLTELTAAPVPARFRRRW